METLAPAPLMTMRLLAERHGMPLEEIAALYGLEPRQVEDALAAHAREDSAEC